MVILVHMAFLILPREIKVMCTNLSIFGLLLLILLIINYAREIQR